ncbi:MAG: hypothetical protein IIU07_04530 [Lachnospiraceae bacterium]|nr:hypothetical protein [Lachnospiraceae bacterium]
MNYCPKCKIVIRGEKQCCPLCQGKITGVPDGATTFESASYSAFPVIDFKVSSFTFIKIVTFLFLVLEISFAAVGWILGRDHPWVGLVMLGILVGWIDVLAAMYVRGNLLKLITVEAYVAMAVNIYVDYMTHMHGWSLAWVTPFTLLGLGVITLVIARIRKLRPSEYVTYIVVNTAAALLQLIPIRSGLNPVPIPAVIIIACHLILMAAVIVFRSRDLKTALGRRFSV